MKTGAVLQDFAENSAVMFLLSDVLHMQNRI